MGGISQKGLVIKNELAEQPVAVFLIVASVNRVTDKCMSCVQMAIGDDKCALTDRSSNQMARRSHSSCLNGTGSIRCGTGTDGRRIQSRVKRSIREAASVKPFKVRVSSEIRLSF